MSERAASNKEVGRMNNWQDPYKEFRRSVELAQTLKDPMREIRKSLMMIQNSTNTYKEVSTAINSLQTINDPMKEVRKSLDKISSISDPYKEIRKAVRVMQTVNDPLKEIRKSMTMMQTISNPFKDVGRAVDLLRTMKDPMKEMKRSLIVAQSTPYNLNPILVDFQIKQAELAVQGIDNIDKSLKGLVDELSPAQTKEVYEEIVEIVKGNEDIPDELVGNDVINVYSFEQFRQLSYKIITGVIIILVSSGLKWDEIEKIVQGIFSVLGAISAVKSLTQESKEETTVINNYHIHAGSKEEAVEVIKQIEEGNEKK
jgi:myosin heavy subunit